ncbi:DgyrCDS2347 [Dimorphilus gyrociliatus]|uniref:DgyrCDS2347 n=1 Tax=Dimorphilus gyrociliatus TaxID=2664684 RepID=A0A7I8VBB4_9ANNE|nr:DgyrCDS2347 [Dimorphilus gyrociliatus]
MLDCCCYDSYNLWSAGKWLSLLGCIYTSSHEDASKHIYRTANLAISDLSLCVITQPFNLLMIHKSSWPLGATMCKLVPMFAGTNVFVSTMSIAAIALDRFQMIVYPTRDSIKQLGALAAIVVIWFLSILMASPQLLFVQYNDAREDSQFGRLPPMCIEGHSFLYEKAAYSISSLVIQYIVPIVIVTSTHARIFAQLKRRFRTNQISRNKREGNINRRTTSLLLSIALTFGLAWLPLNIVNIIADFNYKQMTALDSQNILIALCHISTTCSACVNPVLYGWLNENFKKEFRKVLRLPLYNNKNHSAGTTRIDETKSLQAIP